MLVALPFHSGDAEQAAELLLWIGQLGGAPEHDAVLVADFDVDWSTAVEMHTMANRVFRRVELISTPEPALGWPRGCNALFLTAASHCAALNRSFLWLEPDCVPLARDWLDRIHRAYGNGFMGHIYECNLPGLPRRLLSGIAVYPPNAHEIIHPFVGNEPHRAWDVSAADKILESATDCALFHHLWGEKDLSPTFVRKRYDDSPANALTLDHLRKGAILFHRNKDGTLRRLVAAKLGIAPLTDFVVVLPVCNYDSELMLRLLDWILVLGGSQSHEALVSYDNTTIRGTVSRIVSKASQCFSRVHQTNYSVPKGAQFPQTAAWHHAARVMEGMQRAWLWLEADCVPLKSHWLKSLQSEYDQCGKPFCGPIVHGPGHCNGTAIYPANTPKLLPKTMTVLSNAWDVQCREEMGPNCYDSAFWQLAWGVTNGRLDPISGTELPSFPKGSPLLHQIRRNAVIYHRDKTGSLIERLREK